MVGMRIGLRMARRGASGGGSLKVDCSDGEMVSVIMGGAVVYNTYGVAGGLALWRCGVEALLAAHLGSCSKLVISDPKLSLDPGLIYFSIT